MPRSAGSAAGFTLIELLIAMVVFGLLLGGLGTALQLATRVDEAGTDRHVRVLAPALAREVLHGELSRLRPLPMPAQRGGRGVAFGGSASALTFLTELPTHLGGNQRWMRLHIADGMLVIDHFPTHDPQPQSRERSVLLEDAEALKIRYFEERSALGPGGWREDWNDRFALPSMIMVTLAPRERWHPLLVRPMVERLSAGD